MKKIIIAYWRGSQIDSNFYSHNQEFTYSDDKRISLVEEIFKQNYDLMTQRTQETLILWVSIDKFNIK